MKNYGKIDVSKSHLVKFKNIRIYSEEPDDRFH